MSGHFYISRGIFANRTAFYSWPEEIKRTVEDAVHEAIAFQRKKAEQEATESRKMIELEGCEVIELSVDERKYFVDAVKQQHDEARGQFGDAMFELIEYC